jgi:hypothetical protein
MDSPSIARWYRFGYRGIWFNLALLLFSTLIGYFFFAHFSDVILHKQESPVAAWILILAVVLETIFFPLKLRDINRSHVHDFTLEETKNDFGAVFIVLLMGTLPTFLALNYAFQALGIDPLENENIPGLVGFFVTLRFLVFLGLVTSTNQGPVNEYRAMLLDFGVTLYSSIYYVSLWQVMMLAPADLSPYLGKPLEMALMLFGYTLIALLWLTPIRAPYLLEEWWSDPSKIGLMAVIGSTALLVADSLVWIFFPMILSG